MNPPNTLLACSALAAAFAFAGPAGAANVLVNGSFEGNSGWGGALTFNHPTTAVSGIQLADTGGAQSTAATGNFDFNSLTYGLNGTISMPIGNRYHAIYLASSQIVSTVGLNAGASSAEIDGGNARFSFSTWLASNLNDDNIPALRLRFYDTDNGTGTVLQTILLDRGVTTDQVTTAQLLATGSALNGAEDARTDPDYWALYRATGTVPTGTRSAIVDFVAGTGNAGTTGGLDWYGESAVLDIVAAPVPEPAGVLLGGLGALGLLRRRRPQA